MILMKKARKEDSPGLRISSLARLGVIRLVQFERVVQGAHSEFGVFFIDQTGNLNLGRTDHLDVDVFLLQGGEGLGRHAGVVTHSHADDASPIIPKSVGITVS